MTKKLNEAGVLAISNIGAKREGSKTNYTPKTEKVRTNRSINAKTVERSDSDKQCNQSELNHYRDQMTMLVGNSQIPGVTYKGNFVPRRVLSDFSYLTR